VVQPEDNIAVLAIIGKIGASDGNWFIGVGGEDGEGAGSIETDALDVAWVYIRLADDTANTFANAMPNVGGRLFLKKII